MGNLLDMVVRQVKEFFGRLTRGQIIRMVVLVLLSVAIIIVAAMMFGREEYTSLYSSSDEKAMAAVYDELVASGVPVQVRGGALWVPTAQAESLRLQLASKDLLTTGSTYDILKEGFGIGSTAAGQKAMQTVQLEANIRATLMHMNRIQDATVMLTQPESSPFVLEKDDAKPTASISVEVLGGERLGAAEVQAIANLVSSAVKDLKPEDVSIVDTNMHYYPYEEEEVPESSEEIVKQYQMEQVVQKRLEDQAIKLLSPIFGPDKVSVGVSVHLNFDKKQQQEKILEPPVEGAGNQGLIISMKELQETIRGDAAAAGQPGQDTNGGNPVYPYATDDGAGEPYAHFEREMNMEVNEIKTMIDMAKGQITDLSVAVIIDNEGAEDYSAQVKSLMANALGIRDKTRITVSRMPFQEKDTSAMDARTKADADAQRTELIKLGIIVLAALIVMILFFKLLRDILRPRTVIAAAGDGAPPVYDMPQDAVEGVDYVVDDEGNIIPIPASEEDEYAYEPERRKNEKQAFVEKLIQEDPEIAAQLLRTWLMEE